MRTDIKNITNELAINKGLDFDLMATYKAIFDFCKENKTRPRSNNYKIISGCLFINNKIITRVAPIAQRITRDAIVDYYENKILESAEIY